MAEIPLIATNDQTAEESFIFRKLYRDLAFPATGPRSIDFWYEKPLYGKIDRRENPVVPKRSVLKQLPSLNGTHFAVDFVVDAFSAMSDALRKGIAYGNVDARGSVYAPMQVTRAVESTANTYYEYLEIIDKAFIENYIFTRNRIDEITNFDLYMKNYMSYLYDRTPFVPINKSSFVLSKYAIPNISGLIIEVDTEDHAKDSTKKRSWIDDPNFEIIRKTAQEYGFMVDKNAPWRFVADLSSPFMQKYGEIYGVHIAPGSASNVFDTHYNLVYNDDVDLLKKFFKVSYEGFYDRHPTYTKRIEKSCKGVPTVSTVEMARERLDSQNYNKKYTDSYWIQVYLNLRLREIGIPLTEPRRKVMIKQMLNLLPILGQREVIKRINKKVVDLTPNRWWSWEPNLTEES
tara:strand:+ start:594 stop:1802 length:1209 start_codon:yes stop_codon:yes gene_type:complete